jgi:two-component system, OmpR family, sensor histidine kinase KdpD
VEPSRAITGLSPYGVRPEPPVHSARTVLRWSAWLGVLAVVTVVLFAFRPQLDKAHVALGFLIVVLGGSAAGGRALGVALALLAFFLFNFLFIAPYYTFIIGDPLDWLVLAAFLTTGVVAAQLLNRGQERAEIARQRAVEVERLAALGSETLNAGRAEDALLAIAEMIRSTIGVDCCEVLVPRGTPPQLTVLSRAGPCPDAAGASADVTSPWSLAAWVAEKRSVAAERADGTKWIGGGDVSDDRLRWPPEETQIRTLLAPLIVRERAVGVLRVSHARPFVLDSGREQFLSALSFYAALGVERVQLVAEAERAEAFRQADTLKSALIAGVSHDLRTPLTTIKALAHSLGEAGNAEALAIEEEADRLNRLVADLLDLSRLNAGAMPLRPEINAVEDLIGAALRRVAGAVDAKRIRVVGSVSGSADGDPVVLGRFDFVQSLRALVNLIENADKYSPPGAPIEMSVTRSGDRVCIHVADRGPGVDDMERSRIFEPFYRAPNVAPDVGGAGLGLAIAKRLAAEQGGDVVHEQRRGGGSVFTLVLPAADTPPNDSGVVGAVRTEGDPDSA